MSGVGRPVPFVDRLTAVCARRGRLVVGVDPHEQLVRSWGYDYDPAGVEALSRGVVAALADQVGVFKPQSAFFEVFGSAGMAVLQRLLGDIAQAGAVSILDVKRGDIGSTMAAYARAYLDDASPLAVDAVTLSPYLGFDALRPAWELAAAQARGVFVLARTSNPEGDELQLARSGNASVAQRVVDMATTVNRRLGTACVGLVVGATRDRLDIDLSDFEGWILAPGIGAQGGRPESLASLFGRTAPHVLPSASRSVLTAGPNPQGLRAAAAKLVLH